MEDNQPGRSRGHHWRRRHDRSPCSSDGRQRRARSHLADSRGGRGSGPEAGTATDYPIKIKYEDWIDKNAEDVLPKEEDNSITWTLAIANLADGDNDDGIKARLSNLGFPVGEAEATKLAVQTYQALYLDEPDGSGLLADVTDDVKDRRDTP